MITLLTIVHYLAAALVDTMDKILISKEKIRPFNYTFFTVVTGAVALLAWPWFFAHLPIKFIYLNLLSGSFFALTMYVFFKVMSEGEVTRVVPFVFSFIAVFDILIGLVIGKSDLRPGQISALFLLIPGALLLSHKQSGFPHRHVLMKLLSAFLFAAYNWLWQYGAQQGPVLNNYMWNRIGAAGILILLLLHPSARKQILAVKEAGKKVSYSILFLVKQMLGGANFIFYSFLIVLAQGSIAMVDGLQGLRYVFLLFLGLLISNKRDHFFKEELGKPGFYLKLGAVSLIVLGTLLLFIRI